ncbi:nucleoporin Nup85-like protein [Pilaira anomala]|nr:nucleoporin Nup85-like protein [Pilaira anomala]
MDLIEQYYGPVAKKERELYLEIKQVWILCKVLFFSDGDRTDVAIRLMNWYNKCHKYYLLEFDRQSIYYSQSTFDHADFWPYTIRLILLGQIEEVSNLFKHVLSDVGFQLHRKLTRYVEFIHTLTSKDINHIRTQSHRIQQVLAELNHVQPSLHVNYLADVLNLFMANQDIILRYTKDDILGLITSAFYQENKTSSIHEFADLFFARHKSNDHSPIRYFLQGNLNLGIEHCAGYDWWCIAHLTDLLNKKNMLPRHLNYSLENGELLSMDARDYLVLTYASYLNNQFGLWRQSFTYLLTCGELGKDVIIEHMKKMDFQNDDEKLNHVVKFCFDYSMKNDGLVLYEFFNNVCHFLEKSNDLPRVQKL